MTHYVFQEILGEGAFGITFKSVDQNGKNVALKYINIRKSNESGVSLGDIYREINVLKELSKLSKCERYVVCYYSDGISKLNGENHVVLISEFIHGKTLRKYIQRTVTYQHTFSYVTMQLLTGLRFIHQNGYAHRDIKPENIIITDELDVKYIDFGMVCIKSIQGCSKGLVGSLLYMPPEYFSGTARFSFDGEKAHDIWSLTMILFELANGSLQLPFDYWRLPEKIVEKNIMAAPSKESEYPFDDGQINAFVDRIIVNDWKTRPTVEKIISFFIETVPMTRSTIALIS